MEVTREMIESLQSFSTEGEYRSSPSLNYSLLKEIPNGPRCLAVERSPIDGPAIRIGSYVDTYFTNRENISNLFYVESEEISLTDTILRLYNSLVETGDFNPTMELVLNRCAEIGAYASIVDKSKIEARIPSELFKKLRQKGVSNGKTVLTKSEYSQALNSISSLASTPSVHAEIMEGEGQIIIDQFKYEFSLKIPNVDRSRKFKIMIDKLKFDNKRKLVTGIDIKTGEARPLDFGEQFMLRRYDLQGILYSIGIQHLMRELKLNDWTYEFKFIYLPKISGLPSICVKTGAEWCNRSLESVSYNGKTYPGFMQIIRDADWYIENQEFSTNRVLIENQFNFNIEDLL